ncbi:ER membrane protein complex subunit 9 isoform 3 [Mus musculus]|uniref:ER membrane protein complex subunit 9 isoform 3 n=2 Tax=Mus musculus TaxID=10090 RepID=UPI00001E8FC2|nr:ER membrane protein complex subunit 9 isoform 3 [Mus musculus]EDL36280.1 RIKEN cDNA 1500005A01, isoform CRA_a [Mus musculus]|eukprot:XP_006519802.1 PREDICTED: ER membrane protein complex subunit 9 isoform X1 [Mus musculus]
MGEVEISARAYGKMCLHASRYPHAAVNGLLLAPATGSGECLCLTDCVPLFHSHLALSVMLEVALNQVDVWGAQAGLVVAGYYHANAVLDDQRVMWRDWEESRQMVGALLEGRAHQHLVDFDCHLDDIRQDWTNQRLNTQITQWSGSTDGNA